MGEIMDIHKKASWILSSRINLIHKWRLTATQALLSLRTCDGLMCLYLALPRLITVTLVVISNKSVNNMKQMPSKGESSL